MADHYLKSLESERKALWAQCRLKGLPRDTPERQRILAIDAALAAHKAKKAAEGKGGTPHSGPQKSDAKKSGAKKSGAKKAGAQKAGAQKAGPKDAGPKPAGAQKAAAERPAEPPAE